jgi:hypothetical protein
VGSPAGVCDTSVRIEDLGQIGLGLLNELLELDHLANLLVSKHLILLVSVDSETGRVIATVFEAGEACWGGTQISIWELSGHGQAVRAGQEQELTIDEGVEDVFPVSLHQVVDVSENSTERGELALEVLRRCCGRWHREVEVLLTSLVPGGSEGSSEEG